MMEYEHIVFYGATDERSAGNEPRDIFPILRLRGNFRNVKKDASPLSCIRYTYEFSINSRDQRSEDILHPAANWKDC